MNVANKYPDWRRRIAFGLVFAWLIFAFHAPLQACCEALSGAAAVQDAAHDDHRHEHSGDHGFCPSWVALNPSAHDAIAPGPSAQPLTWLAAARVATIIGPSRGRPLRAAVPKHLAASLLHLYGRLRI